jgi:uncharacterized protein with FMN-binding domain
VTITERPTRNLIALASAAVVAIYGAGYLRTRSAAQQFAGDSQRRQAAVEAPKVAATAVLPASTPTTTPPMTLGQTPAKTPAKPAKPAPVAEPPTVVAVQQVDSTPAIVIAPPAVPPVVTPASSVPAPQPIDSAPHPADSVRAKLKDGTYTGYGTSRHGDIEAAVEIKDGHIVSAYITQCLTRYPCSRIAAIIPQVAARQSAEVDYVTGATQSSDAFYYAVREALSKAK